MKIRLQYIPFHLTLLALVASLLGGALTFTPARGASFNANDAASLIAAIHSANGNSEADVITLTDNITLTAVDSAGFNGGDNGTPYIYTDIIINGDGYTISRDAAAPAFRILEVISTGSLTLQNVTIDNGRCAACNGGGVFNEGTLTVTNSSFTNNYAFTTGGAINNFGGTVTLTDVNFSGNSVNNNNSAGGAIYNVNAIASLTGVTFTSNNASLWGGSSGGAIFSNNSTNTLNNVTFNSNSASTTGVGGGMVVDGGSATLENVTFTGNSANLGAGLYNVNANPSLTDVTFSGNTGVGSNNSGGGMYTGSAPTLTNVTFNTNSASFGGGMTTNSSNATLTNVTFSGNIVASLGGGMYNFGSTPQLTDVTFISNQAGSGGGMFNFSSSPALTDVTFNGNSANTSGGGMTNNNSSNPTLTNVTLSNNTANNGGGIANDNNSIPTLTNITLSDNSAATFGGGMFNNNGSSPTLTNVTFSGNEADNNGGGMFNLSSSPTLTNVIIANSVSGGDCVNESSTLDVDSSNNLIENAASACGLVDGEDGNIIGEDPLLGPLADNGGSTQTHALLPGSPAIDAGTNTGCPTEDQRGVMHDSACDIGAFAFVPAAQSGPEFIVNTDADTDDGSCDVFASGFYDCTLREAINAANANADANTITFADDYTITLDGSQLPAITTEMTINGNGAANTILQASDCNPVTLPDGCAPAIYRVFFIDSSDVVLNDLTVRHGDCSSCMTGGPSGGGVWNDGTLTINNSNISDNKSAGGGGINNFIDGTLTINNSTLSGNYASQQGGAIDNVGSLTITASTFNGNTAAANGGGAVYSNVFDPYEVVVTNSTFYQNTATGSAGGGMRVHGILAPLTLRNNTFSHNSGPNNGGAIYLGEDVQSYLYNNIFANSLSGSDCVADGDTQIMANVNNLMETSSASCGTPAYTFDPNLDALADNGGTTQTMALLSGSQAIDAGDNATCATEDQRGVTRDSACDIGAYEFDSTAQSGPDFIVNTDADTDDGSCDVFASGFYDCTLREAINAANANVDASTITFADDYTITLDGSQLPAITTEITINGNGAANTILQANENPNTATYRVLEVGVFGNLTLNGVTVQHGRCNGSCATFIDNGGGMLNSGTATLTNVTFSGNSAGIGGGGMYNENSTATLTNLTFSGNSATNGGGMFNSSSSPILTNVTFSSNSATDGGGMVNVTSSSPTLTNVTFNGNSASNIGGGMFNSSSSPILTNVTFNNNEADFGGGMYNHGSNPSLTNVTFTNNTAIHGGGAINSSNSNSAYTNVTFSGNTASSNGGGMYNYESSPTLTNVTIANNTAINGGGMYNVFNSMPVLKNTIIAMSVNGGGCLNDNSSIDPSSSNNLLEDASNACELIHGANGNILGANPNLGPLADNGGSTQTHALLAGSVAIDAGTNTGCPAEDQRGVARDSACDIGAYEYVIEAGSLTFKSNAKQDGWVLESAETSNKGGTLNRGSATLLLGDDAQNRQYRSILSFNTSAIPDGANITNVTLLLKRAGSTSGNPFNIFNGLMVDVRKGSFGKPALQLADFKGSTVGTYGPFKPPLLLEGWLTGWYIIDLTPAAARINDAGLTQIRLRFQLDDNNNSTANLLRLYSGNAAANNRPQLFVEYGTP